jgi:hypothetical protein
MRPTGARGAADDNGGKRRANDGGRPRAEAQVPGVERAASLVLSRLRSLEPLVAVPAAGSRLPDALQV